MIDASHCTLGLTGHRVASLDGMKRLTVPSGAWISAHRVNPDPQIIRIADPTYASSKVRQSRSNDPLVLRYETTKVAIGSCGPQKLDHASQVLRARAAQFVEQQPAPEETDQAVDVPQWERNGESDIADREDR